MPTRRRARCTVDGYIAGWLHALVGRARPGTVRAYRCVLEKYVCPAWQGRSLASISRRDVRALLGAIAASGRAPNTVRQVYAALSSVYATAIDEELLDANPIHGALRRIVRRENLRPREAFTPAELARFLETARTAAPQHWALFLVMARTGIRIGEALGLRAGDVDVAARRLRIARTYLRNGATGPTKTGKVRHCDLSPEAAAVLRERAATAEPPDGWLFASPYRVGGPRTVRRPYDPASVRYAFRETLRAAGLPEDYIPHSLRHTFASILLARGVPITYVQRALGHGSISVTVDTYGSHHEMRNLSAVAALDGVG
jgi:integrase